MVIWILGKSGSGKSYLAKKIFNLLEKKYKKVFWIDGDEFREFFSKDLKYSIRDRKKNSDRMRQLCVYLEKKKFIVICSILSIFKDHQKKNRNLFKNYYQVFIKANQKTISRMDVKGVYKQKTNVVGKDLKFPTPYKSDMILKNNFNNEYKKNIKKIVNEIQKFIS